MLLEWLLVLTVCGPVRPMCVSQLVERHDTIGKCIVKQVEYSKMPKDGDWKSVVYECKLKNGMKV